MGDIEIIINEEPELGRTGSVKKGLNYLKERRWEITGFLSFQLIDQDFLFLLLNY